MHDDPIERLRAVLLRLGMLVALALFVLLFLRFFRNIGPAEVGIVVFLFGLVFLIESIRYIINRFIRGLRGDD